MFDWRLAQPLCELLEALPDRPVHLMPGVAAEALPELNVLKYPSSRRPKGFTIRRQGLVRLLENRVHLGHVVSSQGCHEGFGHATDRIGQTPPRMAGQFPVFADDVEPGWRQLPGGELGAAPVGGRGEAPMLCGHVTEQCLEVPLGARGGAGQVARATASTDARTAVARRERPVRSPAALAASIGADKTRLIPVLDDLERRGLVEREPDPDDRRVRLLDLTEAGRDMHRSLLAEVRAAEDELLAAVPAADRAAFLRTLMTLSSQ